MNDINNLQNNAIGYKYFLYKAYSSGSAFKSEDDTVCDSISSISCVPVLKSLSIIENMFKTVS